MPEFLARAKAAEAEATTRKLLAEARAAEVHAEEIELEHRITLANNVFNRTYAFVGKVDAASVQQCIRQLNVWRRTEPGCDLELIFTSPGGSIVDGLALFDFIQTMRREGHFITTHAYGYAASMAGILLQVGDRRVMSKESWLLIHQASFGAAGTIGQVEDTVEWVKRVQDRILDIFAERCTRPRRAIKTNWTRKDWWLSSEEALSWGFIDAIE